MTYDDSNLSTRSDYTKYDQVYIGDSLDLHITTSGDSFFHSSFSPSIKLCLRNVLVVPNISKNLIIVSKFSQDNSIYFVFYSDYFLVKQPETLTILLRGTVKHGLYALEEVQILQIVSSSSLQSRASSSIQTHFSSVVPLNSLNKSSSSVSSSHVYNIWHNRLGHPSSNVVKRVLKDCNISFNNNDSNFVCKSCCFGKFHKRPSPTSQTVYSYPLELIHTDLRGPSPIPSSGGYHYHVHFTDALSRLTWLYLLKRK